MGLSLLAGIWRWGLSTQGVLGLEHCDWEVAGRGTVQILNNGQNPGTVLSDVGAPAVSSLGVGQVACRRLEGSGAWEISYLFTNQSKKKLP